jgi:hypothetical protein
MSFAINKFGVPSSTGDNIVMGQPKPRNRFRVLTYGFGQDTSSGNGSLAMCYSTLKCTRPKLSVETHEMHSFDNISRYTGKTRWNEITIEVKDTVDNKAATAIYSHIQKQKDYYKRVAPRMAGYGYKFELLIQTLNGTHPDNTTDTVDWLSGTLDSWLCTGCIVSEYDFGSYDYENAYINTITLTIQPDNCILLDSTGNIMSEMAQVGTYSSSAFYCGLLGAADTWIGKNILGLGTSVTNAIDTAVGTGLSNAVKSITGGWF